MKRTLILSVAVASLWFASTSVSDAQVFIRAPFVRVAVGDGVSIKAPFVRINTGEFQYPPYYPYPYGPYPGGPPVIVQPVQPMPPPAFQPPPPQPLPKEPVPEPKRPQPLPRLPETKENTAPPIPLQPGTPVQALTLEQFTKSFQPKAGSYEVTLLNPVSKQPTQVRFTLPEGTPRRVHTNRDSIEFVYALRQWVRIEFDKDGAIITSR